jgi:hypothetical protein
VTDEGAKEQVKPAGRPEHVKPTALLNCPALGVTVTVTLPELPGEMLTELGLAPKLRVPLVVVPPQFRETGTAPEI